MNLKTLLFLFIGGLLARPGRAQGDLLITPARVVFEDNKQKETLNLLNLGKDTTTYSISLIHYNMREDGSFELTNEPDTGKRFADPFIRIFPRRVVLAPGEPQAIMLQFVHNAGIREGEYRSHLYFRADKKSPPMNMQRSANDTSKMSVQLIPVFGVSIPVIIRSGRKVLQCTISDIQLSTQPDQTRKLGFKINRTGNISVYGDIRIEFIPSKGKSVEVGMLKGIGVYTNIQQRQVSMMLDNSLKDKPISGKLHIVYSNGSEKTSSMYAEGYLDVP